MHHMKLVLNIRLVALLAVTIAVLMAASSLAPPRQASADYTSPKGVLCFELLELAGNPLLGIGLVRIDDLGGGNITFTSHVYIAAGGGPATPTCQQVQTAVPSNAAPFPAPDGGRNPLVGQWTPGTHTLTADVCQEDLDFGPLTLAWALVDVNFVLDPNPANKAGGTFALSGPFTDGTCTVEDTGFNNFTLTVSSGPFLSGPGDDDKKLFTSDWDKDGFTDWRELAPNLTAANDPFRTGSIGGVAELAGEASTPLAAPDSSGSNTGLIAGIVAAIAAGTVALGGAAWYTRRRSIQ